MNKKHLLKDVHPLLEKFSVALVNDLCVEYSGIISLKDLHEFIDEWIEKNFVIDKEI